MDAQFCLVIYTWPHLLIYEDATRKYKSTISTILDMHFVFMKLQSYSTFKHIDHYTQKKERNLSYQKVYSLITIGRSREFYHWSTWMGRNRMRRPWHLYPPHRLNVMSELGQAIPKNDSIDVNLCLHKFHRSTSWFTNMPDETPVEDSEKILPQLHRHSIGKPCHLWACPTIHSWERT
jgi:hypothetical protein